MQNYKIKITFPSGKTIDAQSGATPAEFLNEFDEKPEKIFAVRVNNELCSLNKGLFVDSSLEPVLMSSKDGSQVYRRTLCFILAAAAHELEPNNNVIIENSFGYAFYYTFQDGSEVPEKFVSDLKEKMDSIIKKNVPIETHFISYEQACQTFESLGLLETRKQLDYICPPRVQMNTIGEYTDLYYGPMMVSTGTLNAFKLQKYLPLSNSKLSNSPIAVLGANAVDSVMMWGNYSGFATSTVTALEGIQQLAPQARFISGCGLTRNEVFESRFAELKTPLGSRGMQATY